MTTLSLSLSLLLLFAVTCTATNDFLRNLGTPSMSLMEYEEDVTVDDDCRYTLTIQWKHPSYFPMGGPDTCAPDVKAPDGLDYFDKRWYYERLSYKNRVATGFDHVSIDWNACGHPGFGFQVPHYDIHIYTVSPEYRATHMACEKVFGTPVCLPESEQSNTGRGYYVMGTDVQSGLYHNLPTGYTWDMLAAVEYMGIHAGDVTVEPDHPRNWSEPLLYLTSYNGNIVSFEPMVPPRYTNGSPSSHFKEEQVEYQFQTITTMPDYWSAEYNNITGITTLVAQGDAAVCQPEYETLVDPEHGNTDDGDGNGSSAVSVMNAGGTWMSIVTIMFVGVVSMFVL